MLARLASATLKGLDAEAVDAEVDLARGLPTWSMVGLPEAAVRESRDRVRSALINSGFEFPLRRITVNLVPADIRKDGSYFDLPVAVGMLVDGLGADSRRRFIRSKVIACHVGEALQYRGESISAN